jgi:prepilin-type N-terminal cleavage/methylation domain-containing protein/prepilin-type processing-associated H-X9-DG protein
MYEEKMMKKDLFTLIELLVVIAIIGILVSILMPGLVKARKSAEKAVCMSNLKQIYTATSSYSAKNSNFLPYTRNGGGYISWDDNLSGYDSRTVLTQAEKAASALPADYQENVDVYRCPSSPAFLDHPYFNEVLNGFMRSYAMNQSGSHNKFGGVSQNNGKALNIVQITDASNSILYTEKKWCGVGAKDDLHYAKLMWIKLLKPTGDLDYGGAEFHAKQTNYLMADGSIKSMNFWTSLQKMDGSNGNYNDVQGTYWDCQK